METRDTGLIAHVEGLVETSLKLASVNATEKIAPVLAGMVSSVLIYLISMFAVLFISFGIAWWVGDMLKNRTAGIFIVGGGYLILLLLVLLFRKKIIYPIIKNRIIRLFYA